MGQSHSVGNQSCQLIRSKNVFATAGTSLHFDHIPHILIDSIELATPELPSNDLESNLLNQENNEEELKVFENSNPGKETKIKEPEMFEESNLEEDFEIPAFLRRQKN